MADYASNMRRYKKLFQHRVMRSEVMKKTTHECNYPVEEMARESKGTSKQKSHKVRDFNSSRFSGNNVIGNTFRPLFDKRLLVNTTQKTKEDKVKKVPFVMSESRTICDIDKDFYKLVQGRPIQSYIDHKQDLRYVSATAKERTNIGYVKDLIFKFDSLRHSYEAKEYQKAIELYDVINEQFRQFLQDSCKSVETTDAKADVKYDQLQILLDQYDTYHDQLVITKYKIDKLQTVLNNLDKYRKFLFMVAPTEWRRLYDDEFKGITSYFENDEATSRASAAARKSLNANKEPQLYLTKPTQLIKIFENIRVQSLNDIQVHGVKSNIIKTLIKSKEYLTRLIFKEADKWQEKIAIFEKNINVLKEQEFKLKSIFDNMLASIFYELYASYDSSKLLQCLQDVNTTVIEGPKVPSNSLFDLAQELENLYMELTFHLDNLDPQLVKAVKTKDIAENLNIMTRAKVTRKQLREFDNIKKNLYASFEPSRREKASDMKDTTSKVI